MLILRKIIKTVATRCQILRLKCTKFDFGWGYAPDPAWGSLQRSPDPLAAMTYFYGGGKGKGEEREEEGAGGEGRGREPSVAPPCKKSCGRPWAGA